MAAAYSNLARLPAAARQQIEAWLADFAEFWHEDYLAVRVRALPPSGDPVRLPAILELVKIDLKRQWQRGRQATVEMYLAQYPELGAPDTVHASLVLAEYEMRAQAGATQDLPHLAQRFPKQAAKLLIPFRQPVPEATVEPRPSTQAPALAPGAAPTLPPQFGRYRIVKRLGQGGMGAVYLAHDTQLDRAVALKVPHISTEDGPGVLKRFHREARAAAALEHPNLCRVYDVGTQDDVPYLTMAYVEGPTLAHVIKGGTLLPQTEAAGVVHKLALAMVEAHAKGIIHRDLKPSNVMITQRGEPVIMDFGLARQSNVTDTRVTRLGAMMGTPSYMPPEQVRGQADAMGPGCDIYSLGVILYQLLTGHVPFEGPMDVVLGQILTQPPPPPSSYRPDLDPLLETICLRALQKEIVSRHANMADLAEALTSWLAASTPPIAAARPLQPTMVESLAQAVARVRPIQPPVIETPVPSVAPARPLQPTMIEAPAAPVAPARQLHPTMIESPVPAVPAARPLQPTMIETPTQSPDRSVSVSGKGKRLPTAAERQRLRETRSAKAKKNRATPEPNAEVQQGADASRAARYARQKKWIWMMSAEGQELADAHSAGGTPEAGRAPFGTLEHWVLAGLVALVLLVVGVAALMRGGGIAVQPAPLGNEAARSNATLAADFVNTGNVLYANKQYDEAFSNYNEAIRTDRNNAWAFNNRGLVWHVKKQNDQGLKDLNEAIRLDPNNAQFINNRKMVQAQQPPLVPDLTKVTPLYRNEFDNPKNGPATETFQGTESGYSQGRFFIKGGPGCRRWYGVGGAAGNFACELVGRVLGPPSDGWALVITRQDDAKKNRGIQISLSSEARLRVAPWEYEAEPARGPEVGPIDHPAIQRGTEFNKLLVVVRGRVVEVYVNGVAVCPPVTVDRDVTPGGLILQSLGRDKGVHIEFERITVWPTDSLPPPEVMLDNATLIPKQDAGLKSPRQLAPPDRSVFNIFPRKTTLRWAPVAGAVRYKVEVEWQNILGSGEWIPSNVGAAADATEHAFNFTGANPGRWRVWAVDDSGREGPKSSWWTFRYTK